MQNSNKPTAKNYYSIVLFNLNDLPQLNNQGHLHNLNKITCFSVYILLVLFCKTAKIEKKLPFTYLKKSMIKLTGIKIVNFI